jgi:hypothetical protein
VRNLVAWIKIKAEIEKSSSTLLPILLKESSEWHNIDDGYESGVDQCQLESSGWEWKEKNGMFSVDSCFSVRSS